jgi:c-di-GMP-binding flagellar brake protein YcgR
VIANQSEEAQILHAIESDSSATAKYLKQMNSKIEALAELIISSHPDASKFPEQNVSVSETGIDFYFASPLPTDSYVALNMIFMPNYLCFELYAKVITCVPLSSAPDDLDPMYRFGLQFVNIAEHDRDRIARRIFHKQLEERRQQRLNQ